MAKRGNGEGSITRRKDGLYMARYTVQTQAGPKRKTVYGKTRAEASDKLSKALADRSGGLVFDTGTLTVGEYIKTWLSDSVRGTVRDSTHASYEQVARNYLIPGIGKVKLKDLKPLHLRQLYRGKLDAGLSARTVQYIHTVVKKALKDAVRGELIPRNPADAVDPPQVRREEMRPLSPDQVRQLLGAAEGERLEAAYVVAVHTGLRPGELLALRWDDVDLEAGTLQVQRSLSGGKMTAPKTPKSRRRIDLSSGAREALRAHRKRQLEERMSKAGLWQDHGLVFPSSAGTPLDQRNLTRAFKATLKRAGLSEKFRLYDLRHTTATILLSQNRHPKYVQELLGHASIALTLDTYSHVIPGMDGGTASAMDEALG